MNMKSRGAKHTEAEDVAIAIEFVNISTNPIVGAEKKAATF